MKYISIAVTVLLFVFFSIDIFGIQLSWKPFSVKIERPWEGLFLVLFVVSLTAYIVFATSRKVNAKMDDISVALDSFNIEADKFIFVPKELLPKEPAEIEVAGTRMLIVPFPTDSVITKTTNGDTLYIQIENSNPNTSAQ